MRQFRCHLLSSDYCHLRDFDDFHRRIWNFASILIAFQTYYTTYLMRLHRFYIGSLNGAAFMQTFGSEKICLDGAANGDFAILIHQWRDVFRYTVGSRVLLFDDNKTEYLCMIEAFAGPRVTLVALEKSKQDDKSGGGDKKAHSPGVADKTAENKSEKNAIWLFLSILKNENFDLVIQKATELGVDHIVPILADRTIKKNINMKRAEKIAVEASEQSGRISIPCVHEPVALKKAIDDFMAEGGDMILCHQEGASWLKTKPSLKKYPLGFLVGPEGGWSPKEENMFNKMSLRKVKISENVLRAETAAIGLMSLVKVV